MLYKWTVSHSIALLVLHSGSYQLIRGVWDRINQDEAGFTARGHFFRQNKEYTLLEIIVVGRVQLAIRFTDIGENVF